MFGQANGQLSQCVGVGDMPVIARTQNADGTIGKPCQILITDVRCVPNFAYTLLSVTQLWEGQHIKSLFADGRALKLPEIADNTLIPFNSGQRSNEITFVSAAHSRNKEQNISGFYQSNIKAAMPDITTACAPTEKNLITMGGLPSPGGRIYHQSINITTGGSGPPRLLGVRV